MLKLMFTSLLDKLQMSNLCHLLLQIGDEGSYLCDLLLQIGNEGSYLCDLFCYRLAMKAVIYVICSVTDWR